MDMAPTPGYRYADLVGNVKEWFEGDVPPATLLGVTALGYEEQLVEIDASVTRSP